MRARRRGHFCWSCGRSLPNEQFFGRGHARHVCREFSRLGNEALEYRQAVRNVDRALRPHNFILHATKARARKLGQPGPQHLARVADWAAQTAAA